MGVTMKLGAKVLLAHKKIILIVAIENVRFSYFEFPLKISNNRSAMKGKWQENENEKPNRLWEIMCVRITHARTHTHHPF